MIARHEGVVSWTTTRTFPDPLERQAMQVSPTTPLSQFSHPTMWPPPAVLGLPPASERPVGHAVVPPRRMTPTSPGLLSEIRDLLETYIAAVVHTETVSGSNDLPHPQPDPGTGLLAAQTPIR